MWIANMYKKSRIWALSSIAALWSGISRIDISFFKELKKKDRKKLLELKDCF